MAPVVRAGALAGRARRRRRYDRRDGRCGAHRSGSCRTCVGYTQVFVAARRRGQMRPMTLDNLENLLVETDGAVATVTVNRPKVLNALNTQTLDELRRVLLAIRRDDAVRVVILTGAGDKSFIAGADINELSVQTPT